MEQFLRGKAHRAMRPRRLRLRRTTTRENWARIRALGMVFWFALGAALTGYTLHNALPSEEEQRANFIAHSSATFSLSSISPMDLLSKGMFGLGGALLLLLLPWYAAAVLTICRHALLAVFGRPELARIESVNAFGPEREVAYAFVTPKSAVVQGRVALRSREAGEQEQEETMTVLYLPWAPLVSQPRDTLLFEPVAASLPVEVARTR